jgi:hypothetical protein
VTDLERRVDAGVAVAESVAVGVRGWGRGRRHSGRRSWGQGCCERRGWERDRVAEVEKLACSAQ